MGWTTLRQAGRARDMTIYMGIYNIFTSLLQILLALSGQSRD